MVQIINTVDAATEVDRESAVPVNKAENRSLYAAREAIHPKAAHGFFRRLKWTLVVVLLGIYYIAPWLRWTRPGDAPDQAVLIDMANRRFYFFFIEIWPQEFYYVAGLLIMAGVGLFLVTSLVRPRLVRLCLPADGVDRPLHLGRKQDRGRPQCPHQARRRTLERVQDLEARLQDAGLAADRHRDRRRLGLLFRRCADPVP